MIPERRLSLTRKGRKSIGRPTQYWFRHRFKMNPRSTLANAKIGQVFKYCLTFKIESLNNRGLNQTQC